MSNTLFANDLDYITTSRRSRIIGLKFPLPVTPGDGGFFSQSMDKEVVAQNLKQLLLTSKGERLMYPSFGTNLRAALFEPITAVLISELQADIKNAVRAYEPRVVIRDVSVTRGKGGNTTGPNTLYVSLLVSFTSAPFAEEVVDLVIT
tara:strand:+ start:2569 stop:3012 length:444 start_codon:yes stop_codon:yes gene_type:complete